MGAMESAGDKDHVPHALRDASNNAMKITRTVYYYRYTKHDDDLLQYSDPFTMEEAARTEAQQLATQGYRGIIERHHQKKQDDEDDHGWLPDWNVPDNRAIELLDYF